MTLEHAFPGESEFWEGKDFDILKCASLHKECGTNTDEVLRSVWRPLIGPNDDRPMVLCDWTTINPETDIRLNDVLRRDGIGENSLLHFSEAHKWYYIKYQTTNDLVVFRNADSQGERARESSMTKLGY